MAPIGSRLADPTGCAQAGFRAASVPSSIRGNRSNSLTGESKINQAWTQNPASASQRQAGWRRRARQRILAKSSAAVFHGVGVGEGIMGSKRTDSGPALLIRLAVSGPVGLGKPGALLRGNRKLMSPWRRPWPGWWKHCDDPLARQQPSAMFQCAGGDPQVLGRDRLALAPQARVNQRVAVGRLRRDRQQLGKMPDQLADASNRGFRVRFAMPNSGPRCDQR